MFCKRFIPVLILILACAIAELQAQKSPPKPTIHSISNIGLFNGSNSPSIILQTIVAASYKNWLAGVGLGIDYYRFRSVPVFADVRYLFGSSNRSFFLYGDIGHNYPWLTQRNKDQFAFESPKTLKGGLYYDAGIGYSISFSRKDALVLSAGFSKKVFSNEISSSFCPFAGPCSQEKELFVYNMRGVSLKAGWRF